MNINLCGKNKKRRLRRKFNFTSPDNPVTYLDPRRQPGFSFKELTCIYAKDRISKFFVEIPAIRYAQDVEIILLASGTRLLINIKIVCTIYAPVVYKQM